MKYTLLKSKVDNFILLLDEGVFDMHNYLEIEKELLEISFLYREEDKIEKKIVEIFYFFSTSITSSFRFHVNESDIFEVENISTEKLKHYSDRASILIGILLGMYSYLDKKYYFE
ncbi:hypothetical protein ACWIUA_11455 [Ursidibacter sp. B-7004-1]